MCFITQIDESGHADFACFVEAKSLRCAWLSLCKLSIEQEQCKYSLGTSEIYPQVREHMQTLKCCPHLTHRLNLLNYLVHEEG